MTNEVSIKAYSLSVVGSNWETVVNAATLGKAKYDFWLDLKDVRPDIKFTDIRGRLYNKGEPYSSEDYIRVASYRGKQDIKCGDQVIVDGRDTGYVVGYNHSANFDIYFTTGKYSGLTLNVHPSTVVKT